MKTEQTEINSHCSHEQPFQVSDLWLGIYEIKLRVLYEFPTHEDPSEFEERALNKKKISLFTV